MLSRRSLLAALAAARAGTLLAAEPPATPLRFPRDFGAHPESHSEWWYVTGALDAAERSAIGFQITFFRVPTPLGGAEASRFAARQLLFAHAAVSDLARGKLRHD